MLDMLMIGALGPEDYLCFFNGEDYWHIKLLISSKFLITFLSDKNQLCFNACFAKGRSCSSASNIQPIKSMHSWELPTNNFFRFV